MHPASACECLLVQMRGTSLKRDKEHFSGKQRGRKRRKQGLGRIPLDLFECNLPCIPTSSTSPLRFDCPNFAYSPRWFPQQGRIGVPTNVSQVSRIWRPHVHLSPEQMPALSFCPSSPKCVEEGGSPFGSPCPHTCFLCWLVLSVE